MQSELLLNTNDNQQIRNFTLLFVSPLTEYLESVVNMMELWLKMLMSSGDLLTQDICGWYGTINNYY